MAKKEFNATETPRKISSYLITLASTETDGIRKQAEPFAFRRTLSDWIAEKTGCAPELEIDKQSLAAGPVQIHIRCTQALIDKITRAFPDNVSGAERIRSLSEIPPGERGCWKPHP